MLKNEKIYFNKLSLSHISLNPAVDTLSDYISLKIVIFCHFCLRETTDLAWRRDCTVFSFFAHPTSLTTPLPLPLLAIHRSVKYDSRIQQKMTHIRLMHFGPKTLSKEKSAPHAWRLATGLKINFEKATMQNFTLFNRVMRSCWLWFRSATIGRGFFLSSYFYFKVNHKIVLIKLPSYSIMQLKLHNNGEGVSHGNLRTAPEPVSATIFPPHKYVEKMASGALLEKARYIHTNWTILIRILSNSINSPLWSGSLLEDEFRLSSETGCSFSAHFLSVIRFEKQRNTIIHIRSEKTNDMPFTQLCRYLLG